MRIEPPVDRSEPGIAAKAADLARLGQLSPFELRNQLTALATSHADRIMLNAGRGNPNFFAAEPRHGFFQLGLFAMAEAERCAEGLPAGVAGLPEHNGIAERFTRFIRERCDIQGTAFLGAALSYARDCLGVPADAFVHELAQGALGCQYPEPVRMLPICEQIVGRYLIREMTGGMVPAGGIDLFAVEGATAGITYLFHTLQVNKLIAPGDAIAIGTPIFTPYLEIPCLDEYRLVELFIAADPAAGWQYPHDELDRLLDPRVKAFLVVNPGNPTSVKIDRGRLARIADIIATKRPDLLVVTDDVYGTFADNFVSMFALCPRNTILIYSFSKYFGATGWRLGVVATVRSNILDSKVAALPSRERAELDARYSSLVPNPGALKFIDRMAADSRAVALNHTAGLSTPQQVQMALYAMFGLVDREDAYKRSMQRLIRDRHCALHRALGISHEADPNGTGYYALLDFEAVSAQLYGRAFADWLIAAKNPLDILFRLADEAGVVLLPGKGFGTPHPSARVSLANLNEADYVRIGLTVRSVLAEYADEYRSTISASAAPVPA